MDLGKNWTRVKLDLDKNGTQVKLDMGKNGTRVKLDLGKNGTRKCRASSGRWPRGDLTLVAPCGLLGLRLRRNGPVCGCDGGVEMSGVGTAVLASLRG
ncbi:hypothetical protein ACOMHN_042315 [Nucella lapillus]